MSSLIVALADAARPRVAPAPTPAPALSDEEDGPALRTRSAAASTTSEPPTKRSKSGRTTSDYRRIGAGSVAATAYTPTTPRGAEAFVARMVRMLEGGGTVFPTFASKLDVQYKPLAVLGDKPKTTEDLIKEWTIAATREGRANGTRPTFVHATQLRPANSGKYAFYPSRSHYWLTNIQGKRVSRLSFIFEPVGVELQANIDRGRVTRDMKNVTKARLDMIFGTSKAIERDEDDDSDEELVFKYEKDQPAGEILKFVVNKYMEHYFPAGGRVA